MFGNPYTPFVLELCKHCGEPSPSSSQVGTHPMMGQLLVFARHLNFDKEMSWDIFLLYIASSDWQHLTEKALCSGSYFCWRNYSLQLKPCKCHWLSVSWNAKLRGLRCLTNLRLCTGKFPFSVHSFFHLQSVSRLLAANQAFNANTLLKQMWRTKGRFSLQHCLPPSASFEAKIHSV